MTRVAPGLAKCFPVFANAGDVARAGEPKGDPTATTRAAASASISADAFAAAAAVGFPRASISSTMSAAGSPGREGRRALARIIVGGESGSSKRTTANRDHSTDRERASFASSSSSDQSRGTSASMGASRVDESGAASVNALDASWLSTPPESLNAVHAL